MRHGPWGGADRAYRVAGQVGREFFTPLADHTHAALADLPDGDLAAAHRVFGALIDAMGAFRTDLGDTAGNPA